MPALLAKNHSALPKGPFPPLPYLARPHTRFSFIRTLTLDINKPYTYLGQWLDIRKHAQSLKEAIVSQISPRSVGNGIVKNSARPIKIVVGPLGEYWICDKDAEISGFDFASAGCAAHSEVHLVK